LGFLRQLTWVDLRTQTSDLGIVILAKAARGEAPGPDLQKHLDAVRVSICPYRGLLHFREEDAPFFFGREAAIDKLTDAVQRQLLVAVVGASGSGKSSVVRAGLVPRLRSDRRTAWETVILVPTDQPLKALARAFVPLLEPTMGEVDRLAEATKLAEHFRLETISLYDIVERIVERQSGTNRVLIVVDQFEELYTLTSDEEVRRRFLDELLAASSRAGSKANIALTLRGDFVGRALAYRPLSDRLQDAQINLGPMTREELGCAIRKPADKIQLEFEPGLVRRILNDVGDEPGNLPLLEFVLKELWDKRHGSVLLNETYDAIGGLQGAVATKADELLKGLSSAEQKILQRVFLRIVRPSESGLDTRRRAAFTELPPEGTDLVVKLANERLLVTNQSATSLEQTVEVAHEALISNWSTLRTWVNEDREFLLWRVRLGALLTEWDRAQESDEALLRGPLLIEAQKWFDQRSQDLSDQERRFISASRVLRERQQRHRVLLVAGVATVGFILFGVLFVIWRATKEQLIQTLMARAYQEIGAENLDVGRSLLAEATKLASNQPAVQRHLEAWERSKTQQNPALSSPSGVVWSYETAGHDQLRWLCSPDKLISLMGNNVERRALPLDTSRTNYYFHEPSMTLLNCEPDRVSIRLTDLGGRRETPAAIKVGFSVNYCWFSRDGANVLLGSENKTLIAYCTVRESRVLWQASLPEPLVVAAIINDVILLGFENGELWLCDAHRAVSSEGGRIWKFPYAIHGVRVTADQKTALVTSERQALVLHVQNRSYEHLDFAHSISASCLSEDGARFFICDADGNAFQYALQPKLALLNAHHYPTSIRCITVDASGQRVAVALSDGSLHVNEMPNWAGISGRLTTDLAPVSLALRGEWLCAFTDSAVGVWRLPNQTPPAGPYFPPTVFLSRLQNFVTALPEKLISYGLDSATKHSVDLPESGLVVAIAASSANDHVAAATADGVVFCGDAALSGLKVLHPHVGFVSALAVASGKPYVAVGDDRGALSVMDAATGTELRTWEPSGNRVNGVRFSGGARYLAVENSVGEVTVMEVTGWRVVLTAHHLAEGNLCRSHTLNSEYRPGFCRFADDEETLLSTGMDGRLVVWKLPGGQLLREIKTGTQVSAVVWSGHEFKVGTSEGEILRYTADGVGMKGFHAVCDSGVHDLAVDRSGDVIVASSDEGSVVAVDAKDGRELGLPFHFRVPPELLSFAVEGKVTVYAAEHGLFELNLFPEQPARVSGAAGTTSVFRSIQPAGLAEGHPIGGSLDLSGTWNGSGREGYPPEGWRYELRLAHDTHEDSVQGTFKWWLTSSERGQPLGYMGTENVVGSYDPRSRLLRMSSVEISSTTGALSGAAFYRIFVTPDGARLANGTWGAQGLSWGTWNAQKTGSTR
jgi:WD40 repeat protein